MQVIPPPPLPITVNDAAVPFKKLNVGDARISVGYGNTPMQILFAVTNATVQIPGVEEGTVLDNVNAYRWQSASSTEMGLFSKRLEFAPASNCGWDRVPVPNSMLVFVPPVTVPVTGLAAYPPVAIRPVAVPVHERT